MPPPLDMPVPEYFEPIQIETDVAGTSASVGGAEEEPDYTTAGYSGTDPRQLDLEQDLQQRIQVEVDTVVKECMAWEQKILRSASIAYLTPKVLVSDYHMPTLPYPLIKQEVLLMKKEFLPQCQPNDLGGYAHVQIEDFEASAIMDNQPKWRENWLNKRVKDRLYYVTAPQELCIDPTFCPRRTWENFERMTSRQRTAWLNYPVLPSPKQNRAPTE